jgi:hypothetical protein
MIDITTKFTKITNILNDIFKCMNDNKDNIYITQTLSKKKKLLEDSLDNILLECMIDYNQIHFYKLHVEREELLKTPDIKDFNNKLIEINQKLTLVYDQIRNKIVIFDNVNTKKV